MPMDYDDNDTSRHNLQLAGEGRTRSSSALRPYDFPKFDFDDSLQGHLRFDSLVETEVFLGIQSQEDNQWIEDFSRDSNGMEFNPTPADSCSISRRNNVWSEATSSESVEMLLKSVGQEEMMPGASIIPESEVAANQGSPSRHVETSYKLNERNDAYVSNSETALPLDEVLNYYPDARTQTEDQLKDALPTHAIVDSACRNSNDINQNALCGSGGASTNEGKQSYDDECAVKYTEESQASTEKTTDFGIDRDSAGFLGTADNNISNFVMPGSSKASKQVESVVSHDSCSNDEQQKNVSIKKALEDTEKLEGKAGVVSIQTCTASSSLGLDPESGRDIKETSLDAVRESEMKSSEGDDQYTSFTTSVQTLRHEDVLATSNEVDEGDGGFQGVSSVDGITQHTAELGSFNSEHCAVTQQKMDPTVQLPHKRDDDHIEAVSARPLTYEGMSEMPLLSMEDKEVPSERGDAIGNTDIGSSSDITMVSSAADNKDAKNVDGCCNDSMVTINDPGESLLVHEANESIQGIQRNLVQRQDIRKTAQVDEEAFSDLRDMDSEDVGTLKADNMTQSPELGKGVKINDSIRKLQPHSSGELESANNLSPLTTSNSSAVPDDLPEIGQREPDAFGVIHSDNDCEDAGTKKTHDALGTFDEDTSKAEVNVANDIVRTPLSEMAEKSQQLVEKVDDVYSAGTSSVDAVNSSYLDHQAHLGCNLKGSVDADLVSGDNLPKVLTKEGEKESVQTAEVDKASCGSPTIISSSEPLLLEKDNKDEEKGHQVTNENVEDKDIKSISEDPKRKDLLGDDSSFTFKVSALPDTSDVAPAKSWSPFPDVEKGKVVEEIAPSGKAKPERTPSQKTPRQSAQVCDGKSGPGTSKGTSERKGRRGPAKGMAKENVKKGNQSKGTIQENSSKKVERTSTPNSSPHLQFGQIQPYGTIESSNKKPSGAAAVPTSSLPDLNNSALNNSTCQSGLFRQPFTDLQQVQLRAQIFVYGSLLQGNAAPDEACMVSAFGASDGGRSTWEPIWRVAVERVRSQKSSSTSTAAETPRSQSGARTSDAAKQGSHSSKVLATPMSRASSKDTPAAVSNFMIPFSSPLWNIATPSRDNSTANTLHKGPVVDFQQAFTPVQSFQTPPIRNFVGHTSWPQTCFSGPLLASPQTATFSSSTRFQPVTMTETVKLTPVKDTSAVLASSVKHMASIPSVHTVNPSPAMGGLCPLQELKTTASREQHSVDTKPRKRKKVPASDLSQVSLVSESPAPVVVSDVTALSPAPIVVSTPASQASNVILSKSVADASRVSFFDHTKKADSDAEKGVACSEETLSKVAEAKSQAEDAAGLATVAVSRCEDLWSQLAKQKDNGFTSEAEAKLASAAVAIAAAASVAKAAAAAAKIASNAALQAKLMADEAFLCTKTSGVLPSSGKPSSDVHDIDTATPASIIKSNNVTNQSSSILVAAKEAAKRRVEAASAASRQAENLDGIVKAAELAAAAVSQAGKIVAMGEPLPLSELIEAGPEGYWKLPQSSAPLTKKVRDGNMEQSGAVSLEKPADIPACDLAEDSLVKGGSKNVGTDHLSEGLHTTEKDLRTGTAHKASETSRSGREASEPDALTTSAKFKNERDELSTQAEDVFKEGSAVEVFKPGNGLKSAWYTANVLSLEDGRVHVSYNDLMSEEGPGHLQEWVSLEVEADKAPIIRAANPLSTLKYNKTRKRRRAALGDYAWCVGDRVDVWIDDCWWEGVVTEKDEKDETTLKVNIPAQGETQLVRAWNLRASRLWIDGKWIEWSSSRGENASEKSDAPKKRQKLGSPLVATEAKDKESNNVDIAPGKPQQSKFLTLSTSDRTFDIGKTTNDVNKPAARRPLRTNQQKEGSRVIFGVPKPTGKKRKFMEVSKHFPANKSDKSSEVNDAVKLTKYLIPQGSTSRAWKVPSSNDSKERRPAESRPRVPGTRKTPRTLPQRGTSVSTLAQDADKPVNHGIDVENSVGHDNMMEKSIDHGSIACEEGTEAPLSSLLQHSLSTTSKKTSLSHTKSDRLNRGKIVPSGGKLNKIEEDRAYSANASKSNLDMSEPRRSNRRIQPTHRLLEGLQSSMVIPKMPSASHDKGRRNLPTRGK